MSRIEALGLAALRRFDPERAHGLALRALRAGLVPLPGPVDLPRLRTRLAGLDLPNPLGLAAGFDKNAVALAPLMQAGFGFLEVGAATPLPQPGNPRPRVWRLPADGAVINRFGFNNDGAEAIAARLARRPPGIPVGLNLGANRDSPDRPRDFAEVLRVCGPHLDFATVNVSSPNTERLRDLQGRDALRALLEGVKAARDGVLRDSHASHTRVLPLFLKISPDLSPPEIADVAEVALSLGLDAIVATNTTLARDGLHDPTTASHPGGLSGRPLMARSTLVLARLHLLTGGRIPLIGVGGVGSAADAYARLRAGASAVQLYTALTYRGFSLVPQILHGLDRLLAEDGHHHLACAVGLDAEALVQAADASSAG